ncbi:COX15/CtaA family protein [Marinicrinis sediminis]|uniref:Heme A synthase n=1 Tax=Marinicrinis sediminis TaxID=1652465 RepID=A0ABW5R7W9_9BACL
MLHPWIKRLAIITCIGMFLVVLAGAVVTQTESGEGCGTDWPLCHGEFIPAYTIESMIEYSHRLVTGIVGLMVLATFIAVMVKVRRKDAKLYAASTLFFTLLQAIMGALAVKYETSSLVMALHFGFSLLAFASTLLLVLVMYRTHLPIHPSGWGEKWVAGQTVSGRFRLLIWSTLIYTYIVVYLGAYVRHTDSGAGCGRDWPLCNGQVIPDFEDGAGIAFVHRLGALLLFVLVAWLAHVSFWHYRHISLFRKSAIALIVLITTQVLSGALVVYSLNDENLYLFAGLFHTVIICVLFSILCYISIMAWFMRRNRDAA